MGLAVVVTDMMNMRYRQRKCTSLDGIDNSTPQNEFPIVVHCQREMNGLPWLGTWHRTLPGSGCGDENP